MQLVKIYDKTCDVCRMLAGIDEEIADDQGFFFRQHTLHELAATESALRDYVVNVYVSGVDGMIDIPIYLLITDREEIQASGVVQNVEELNNLITSWRQWESSQKQPSTV